MSLITDNYVLLLWFFKLPHGSEEVVAFIGPPYRQRIQASFQTPIKQDIYGQKFTLLFFTRNIQSSESCQSPYIPSLIYIQNPPQHHDCTQEVPKARRARMSHFSFAGLQDLMWVSEGLCAHSHATSLLRGLSRYRSIWRKSPPLPHAPRESGHTAAVFWCCSPLYPAATDNLNRAVPSAFGSGLYLACSCGLWGTNKQPQAGQYQAEPLRLVSFDSWAGCCKGSSQGMDNEGTKLCQRSLHLAMLNQTPSFG